MRKTVTRVYYARLVTRRRPRDRPASAITKHIENVYKYNV